MVPPLLLHVRVGAPTCARHGVWLPLFLVWLLLLPFALLLLALAILADFVLLIAGQRYHHSTLLLLGAARVVSATSGTTVRINSEENVVEIDVV